MIGLRPMLAETADLEKIDPSQYLAELKYDGTRAIAVFHNGDVAIYNRRGEDVSHRFPELRIGTKVEAVLDGEIIHNDGSKQDFQRLQPRLNLNDPVRIKLLAKRYPVHLVAFDILWHDGDDLRKMPIEERKHELLYVVTAIGDERYKQALYADYNDVLREIGEGLILKKCGSTYQVNKRSRDWLKLKNTHTDDYVILGYTEGEGWRKDYFGALILGAYQNENGKLVQVGKVGSGFTKEGLAYTMDKLEVLERNDGIAWVKPDQVCEVRYLNYSENNQLRQPIFMRMRDDKSPMECTL